MCQAQTVKPKQGYRNNYKIVLYHSQVNQKMFLYGAVGNTFGYVLLDVYMKMTWSLLQLGIAEEMIMLNMTLRWTYKQQNVIFCGP